MKYKFAQNWYFLGQWNEYPFDTDLWFNKQFRKEFNKLFGVPIRSLVVTRKGKSYQYFCTEDVEYLKNKFFALLSDKPQQIIQALKSFDKLVVQTKAFLQKNSNKTIAPLFAKQFLKGFLVLKPKGTAIDWYAFLVEHWLEKPILRGLYEVGLRKNSASLLGILITPPYISESLKEEVAMRKAVLKVYKKDANISNEAQRLADRFGYLTVFHHNQPKSPQEYVHEINTLLKEVSLQKLSKTVDKPLKDYKKTLEEQMLFLKRIREHDIALYYQLKILREVAKVRTKSDEFTSLLSHWVNGIFEPFFSKSGLGLREWHFALPQEVFNVLEGKCISPRTITSRQQWFFMATTEDGKDYYTHGKKAQELARRFKLSEFNVKVKFQKKVKEIKGQIAFPGKVKGMAKIFHKSEHKSFHKGDILVARMTTVDYLPYMRKSSAIVTDIGGITSHAAIVSRELKIPCIIGTKIATKVLKDGDLVEVDANTGIVKIVKRV